MHRLAMKILIALIFFVGSAGVPVAECDIDRLARNCMSHIISLDTLDGDEQGWAIERYWTCAEKYVDGCPGDYFENAHSLIAQYLTDGDVAEVTSAESDSMGLASECTPEIALLNTLDGDEFCQTVKTYWNCAKRYLAGVPWGDNYLSQIAPYTGCDFAGRGFN